MWKKNSAKKFSLNIILPNVISDKFLLMKNFLRRQAMFMFWHQNQIGIIERKPLTALICKVKL